MLDQLLVVAQESVDGADRAMSAAASECYVMSPRDATISPCALASAPIKSVPAGFKGFASISTRDAYGNVPLRLGLSAHLLLHWPHACRRLK